MVSLNSINLIRTKTSNSPQLEQIEGSLRRTGYIGLIAFLCVGFVIAVVYFIFSQEKGRLESSKQTLVARVMNNAQKEAMYFAIKNRVVIVGKAIQNQKPWDKLLDRVNGYVTPPTLADILVDDQNKITLTVQTDSIDKVVSVVNGIISEANNKKVVNPELVSFQIGNTGKILSTFSFLAVF